MLYTLQTLMSMPLTMEAVIKTVTILLALTTAPVTLGSYWMKMAMGATVKPSSQYDASRRKAQRRNATSCQNLPARRYNFAWHLLLLRQVVRRRSE